MSNSLEALEIIKCILSNHQTMLEEKDKRFEFINIIKKDLERKEELEKENLEWKANNKEIEELYLNENKHWCETTDSLRKENQKLEKAIEKQINQFENLIYRAKKLKTNDIIVCLEEMQDRLKEVSE